MRYIKLFETYSKLDSIKLEDVIGSIKEYVYNTFNNTDETSAFGCESLYHLLDDINIDHLLDEYDIDITKEDYYMSDNFIKLMTYSSVSIPKRFELVKKLLGMHIRGNTLELYRCLSVDIDFINDFKSGKITEIGKYFAYDIDDIGAYNSSSSNGKYLIVLCGNVDLKYPNLKETLLYNLNYSVGLTEKEVILNDDSEIFIDKIYITNDKMIGSEYRFPFWNKRVYSEWINPNKNMIFNI